MRHRKRRWPLSKLGSIEIRPGKGADSSISASAEYDAMACHGGELLFVSLAGSAADLKVMQAVANSGGSIPAYWAASGLAMLRPSQRDNRYRYPHNPGTKSMSPEGYTVYKHRLGFGQEHRLFVSRKPGFLLVASDEAIWSELKSDRITTPVLREWLPFIARKLRENDLLVECEVYPFEKELPECIKSAVENPEDYQPPHAPALNCAMFTAGTKDVDEIVLDGLRRGLIVIKGNDAGDAEDAAVSADL